MEEANHIIESLKARAEDFRERAEACKVDRYADLMRKGAAHLEEEARQLETRLRAARPN